MNPVFCDTQAYLSYPQFGADISEVLDRAQAAGVDKIICLGDDLEGGRRSIQLAEQFPQVYAAVGWNPYLADDAPEDLGFRLRELAKHPKVVAIGDAGLDFHHLSYLPSSRAEQRKRRQEELFRLLLEVAADCRLNCIIHQRDSLAEVLREMERFAGRVRGVFKFYTNDCAAHLRIARIGSVVSFCGIVTFKKAQQVRDTVAQMPFGQFVLSTGSPFLSPEPYRTRRCEPAYLVEVARQVAQVKNCSLETVSELTCQTVLQLFPKIGQSVGTGPLVFISAKSEDYHYAKQLYDFFVASGVRGFLSQESLPEVGASDYRKEIDRAIEESRHMVVVASSREHLLSPYVEAEWGLFINEKRSGRKTGNLVTLAAGSLQLADLPPSLRYYEVIPFGPEGFEKILRYVRK